MQDTGKVEAFDFSSCAIRDRTRAWLDAARGDCPGLSQVELAQEMIAAYLSAQYSAEFFYADTANPEGISEDVLLEGESVARNKMMASLCVLSLEELVAVLDQNRAGDHDGSAFPVTTPAGLAMWLEREAPLQQSEHSEPSAELSSPR